MEGVSPIHKPDTYKGVKKVTEQPRSFTSKLLRFYIGDIATSKIRYETIRAIGVLYHGNLGYLEKSGLRFSKKAFLPSLASSDR